MLYICIALRLERINIFVELQYSTTIVCETFSKILNKNTFVMSKHALLNNKNGNALRTAIGIENDTDSSTDEEDSVSETSWCIFYIEMSVSLCSSRLYVWFNHWALALV